MAQQKLRRVGNRQKEGLGSSQILLQLVLVFWKIALIITEHVVCSNKSTVLKKINRKNNKSLIFQERSKWLNGNDVNLGAVFVN